jgi:membrane-bound ClpP family serine protease
MKPTFTKKNYYILIAGVALIILGYVLMIGGGSDDPNVFNPEIFSFQRITLAPMVCLTGFVAIIVAIMWRPKGAAGEQPAAK